MSILVKDKNVSDIGTQNDFHFCKVPWGGVRLMNDSQFNL